MFCKHCGEKFSIENDFFKAKEMYTDLREKERIKIIDYLKNKGFNVSKKGGNGSPHYTNNNNFEKEYNLTNWKWVSATIENKTIFISLQAFDQDKNSKNIHALFDRIGICVYNSEVKNPDYFKLMETTSLDLPLDEPKLEKLYLTIIEKIKNKGK